MEEYLRTYCEIDLKAIRENQINIKKKTGDKAMTMACLLYTSERRETVRSLSGAGAGYLRGAVLSTRGPGWTVRWWTGCHANGTAGQPRREGINAEGI